MTSKDVFNHYKNGTVDELYKKFLPVFNLIDEWAEVYTKGDLLDENQLALSMDQLSGAYAKMNPIAGAFEAMLEEFEHDTAVREYDTLEKGAGVKTKDESIVKAKARHSVADLRRYKSDFNRYCWSANTMITTAQSRLKRLVIEKGAKGIAHSGETPVSGSGNNPNGWLK